MKPSSFTSDQPPPDQANAQAWVHQQQALAHMNQGMLVMDAQQRVQYFNAKVCQLLELPTELLASHPTLQALTQWQHERGDFAQQDEQLETCLQTYLHHVTQGGHEALADRHHRVTHTGLTLDVRDITLSDGSMVQVFTDITAQVKEHAARTKLDELSTNVQTIGKIGGWEIDFADRSITWTEGVYRIFEADPASFVPTHANTRTLFTPQAWEKIKDSYNPLLNPQDQPTQNEFELEMFTLTGRPIWVLSLGTTTWKRHQPLKRMAIMQDITQRKQAEALVWQQAHFDTLTGLPNRRMMQDRLDHEIKQCRRDNRQLALLFIDLDHFKEINDTLGHVRGDQLLVEAANRIQHNLREVDTVARMGGDEFTVILSDLTDTNHLQAILSKLLQALSMSFQLGEDQVFVSASMGATVYPDDGLDIETLLKNADQALYVAKGSGRNRFSFFTQALQDAANLRAQLTHDLRDALIAQEFRVVYQPIVDLSTGSIHKAEALLRWQHPRHGLVSPAAFVPVAEASGLIVDIGEWVFHQAATQVQAWRNTLHPQFQISINKSPVQFENPNPAHTPWIRQLNALNLPGDSIVVEITEGLLLSNSDGVVEQLLGLHDDGIQVSLDDFGTGYSSLSYLQRFDIDFVKIDQSFVRNLVADSTDLVLCQAIIAMAHALGMRVVAEGVESAEQRDLLAAAGCDFAQGYFYSRPVAAAEFEKLCTQHH